MLKSDVTENSDNIPSYCLTGVLHLSLPFFDLLNIFSGGKSFTNGPIQTVFISTVEAIHVAHSDWPEFTACLAVCLIISFNIRDTWEFCFA